VPKKVSRRFVEERTMIVRSRIALMSAAVALLLLVPSAFAYNGEVGAVVGVEGPESAVCPAAGQTYTATVEDTNGSPLAGVSVSWSTGATTTTNAQGQTSITVTVTGNTTITATANGAVGSIKVTCVQGGVGGVIGLPRTDTAAPSSTASLTLLAVVAAGLALLVPVGLRARRRGR
jgi:hypothetical protein